MVCSENCKCTGCRNYDGPERNGLIEGREPLQVCDSPPGSVKRPPIRDDEPSFALAKVKIVDYNNKEGDTRWTFENALGLSGKESAADAKTSNKPTVKEEEEKKKEPPHHHHATLAGPMKTVSCAGTSEHSELGIENPLGRVLQPRKAQQQANEIVGQETAEPRRKEKDLLTLFLETLGTAQNSFERSHA